ncbi:hypothetical protein F4678DRAFT_446326 [Xylaria arbuscula]|nr:hypothetical protein F4678DRAFT_446326 [Xylaria arbuscula]
MPMDISSFHTLDNERGMFGFKELQGRLLRRSVEQTLVTTPRQLLNACRESYQLFTLKTPSFPPRLIEMHLILLEIPFQTTPRRRNRLYFSPHNHEQHHPETTHDALLVNNRRVRARKTRQRPHNDHHPKRNLQKLQLQAQRHDPKSQVRHHPHLLRPRLQHIPSTPSPMGTAYTNSTLRADHRAEGSEHDLEGLRRGVAERGTRELRCENPRRFRQVPDRSAAESPVRRSPSMLHFA